MNKIPATIIVATVVIIASSREAIAQSHNPRFELGSHFTGLTRFDPTDSRAGPLALDSNEFSRALNPGLGGRFTFHITRAIALETEWNLIPAEKEYTGRARQWFYGLKAGKRRESVGVYAKLRPGYMYFTKSYCDGFGLYKGFYTCLGSYKKNPAMDLGMVIEFYRARRSMMRVDIGDTVVHFGHINRYQPELGEANRAIHVAGGTTHSLQVSVGIGIRF